MSAYPLHGITVLDLCIVLAGPTCGRTLAQYGAHVIKVDPENRPPQVTPWIDVGRGKQSIALDLTKPGGLNAFLPAFLIASLTFFFSVICRSGNAAGMLSLGVLLLVLITSEPLGGTEFFLFLNPFDPPIGVEETMWDDKVLINRSGVFGIGCLMLFLGLRRMERRERLLN